MTMFYIIIGVATAFGLCATIAAVLIFRYSQRQRKLLQTQRYEDMQRFLRRLDHELKNPVTAIRFALANIALTAQTDEQKNAINSIQTQILRISQLITDLRKLAELDHVVIEHIAVDVIALIHEAVTLVKEKPEAQDREIAIAPTDDTDYPLTVYGDKYLLLLVVYNLVDNAIKFTDHEDKVSITAFQSDSTITIEVNDTGAGIPEDEIEHVWQELYRGQSVRHIPGSGLGLSMVKAIVERHGGQVWLESDADYGTTVYIYLPIYAE